LQQQQQASLPAQLRSHAFHLVGVEALDPARILFGRVAGSFDQRLFENNAAAAFLDTMKAYVEEPGLMLSY